MLVLARKTDQEFVVTGPAKIKILAIGRNRVKIGIYAREEVMIARMEMDKARQLFDYFENSK